MRRTEWLNQLKPGDLVIYCGSSLGISPLFVERTTNTQIIVDGASIGLDKMRFNKVNGHMIGGFGTWIREKYPYETG